MLKEAAQAANDDERGGIGVAVPVWAVNDCNILKGLIRAVRSVAT